MKFLLSSLCFFIMGTSMNLNAQAEEILNYDHIYVDYIKSVQLRVSGTPYSLPFLKFKGGASLELSFDEMNGNEGEYFYSFYHMDRNWEFSDLEPEEYLDGFNEQEVQDFWYSSNTEIEYIHYAFNFPDRSQSITRSGNYLLVVTDIDDRPIITKRFIIFEELLDYKLNVSTSLNASQFRSHQRIQIESIIPGFAISDPQENMEVQIMQNANWSMMYSQLYPAIFREGVIYMQRTQDLSFPGFNEYRNFDTRTLQYATLLVHSIEINEGNIEVLLKMNYPRDRSGRTADPDNNGLCYLDRDLDQQINRSSLSNNSGSGNGFEIDKTYSGFQAVRNQVDSRTRSEYTEVIFNLKVDYPYEYPIYILGSFNQFEMSPEYEMVYDSSREIYWAKILLKQGYYDYLIGAFNDEFVDFQTVEGSFIETENNYTIMSYYREPGMDYDRVIGLKTFSSDQ